MKVWVIWDPLHEEVMSVHKTEKSADKKCEQMNIKNGKYNDNYYYLFQVKEFKLED